MEDEAEEEEMMKNGYRPFSSPSPARDQERIYTQCMVRWTLRSERKKPTEKEL
jgi:hypothetical protein